ncbi:hypothetical protein Bca52824_086307, partial [Brassica carinata]
MIHGNTDGKMRQLENIMLEVQSGVQLLKDKQEILEAQLQLSKLQVSKVDQHSDKHSTHVQPTAQPPQHCLNHQLPLQLHHLLLSRAFHHNNLSSSTVSRHLHHNCLSFPASFCPNRTLISPRPV